jgi:general secretion pathway protein G
MKTLAIRKWEGILSLAWAFGGFLTLKLTGVPSNSPVLAFVIVVGLWWGVAILGALAGLRSRSVPGVVTAIVTLACFAYLGLTFLQVGPLRRSPHRALVVEAVIQVSSFKVALDAFRADTGSYPRGRNGLQALVQRPATATNWQGPYIQSVSVPKDPWGNDYIYECPGRHNPNSFDISSQGPPRQHTPIGNWESAGSMN